MIARSLLLFLLLIIIPQLYVDGRFYRHKFGLWRRILLWIPTIAMMVFTIILAMEKDFIPKNPAVIYTYLYIFAFVFPYIIHIFFFFQNYKNNLFSIF